MKATLIGAAGLFMLAGCANDYVSTEAQVCAASTWAAMQADAATADLRQTQKAALVAQACGISVDAIIFAAAE